MHNNPVRRHQHKHSKGLSIKMFIRMGVLFFVIIILLGIVKSNYIPDNTSTVGIITNVNIHLGQDEKDEITVEYDVDNVHYSKELETIKNHYEYEKVTVTYQEKAPKNMYINDENQTITAKFICFLLLTFCFIIMLVADILHIIIFLIKFGIIRIFFR